MKPAAVKVAQPVVYLLLITGAILTSVTLLAGYVASSKVEKPRTAMEIVSFGNLASSPEAPVILQVRLRTERSKKPIQGARVLWEDRTGSINYAANTDSAGFAKCGQEWQAGKSALICRVGDAEVWRGADYRNPPAAADDRLELRLLPDSCLPGATVDLQIAGARGDVIVELCDPNRVTWHSVRFGRDSLRLRTPQDYSGWLCALVYELEKKGAYNTVWLYTGREPRPTNSPAWGGAPHARQSTLAIRQQNWAERIRHSVGNLELVYAFALAATGPAIAFVLGVCACLLARFVDGKIPRTETLNLAAAYQYTIQMIAIALLAAAWADRPLLWGLFGLSTIGLAWHFAHKQTLRRASRVAYAASCAFLCVFGTILVRVWSGRVPYGYTEDPTLLGTFFISAAVFAVVLPATLVIQVIASPGVCLKGALALTTIGLSVWFVLPHAKSQTHGWAVVHYFH